MQSITVSGVVGIIIASLGGRTPDQVREGKFQVFIKKIKMKFYLMKLFSCQTYIFEGNLECK